MGPGSPGRSDGLTAGWRHVVGTCCCRPWQIEDTKAHERREQSHATVDVPKISVPILLDGTAWTLFDNAVMAAAGNFQKLVQLL
jgi:hypothetical protein